MERQAAERSAAERAAAERLAAEKLAAAQRETERLEAERLAAQRTAQQAAADRARAEQDVEARREERLRAIGRQLDEEVARRQDPVAARRSESNLPLSLNTARRARVWGRIDPNAELIRYAEAWSQKIHFNTPADTVRDVSRRLKTNPMVTVAIRSDGSVESVTFVLSSGAPEIDEAIRRIIRSHEPYATFPPALAREYDVVEIRRTWHFDTAVRLY